MAHLIVLISQPRFDHDHRRPRPGDVLPISRYENGLPVRVRDVERLFVLTYRREVNQLWLVAILEAPTIAGGWVSRVNQCPILDVSPLRAALGFEGPITPIERAPRVLTEAQVALLPPWVGPRPIFAVPPKTSVATVEARARAAGLKLPAALAELFARATADDGLRSELTMLGVDLESPGDDQGLDFGEPAVCFATNGFADTLAFTATGAVLKFCHEDDSVERVGEDINAYLSRLRAETG